MCRGGKVKLIKKLFQIEKHPRKGLLPLEWAVLAYTAFTLLLMMLLFTRLHNPVQMLTCRIQAVTIMLALWGVYRMLPCRLTHLCRVVCQMSMLGVWYPDTYELNRILPNMDHLFASAEQAVFGCQPALVFSQACSHPVVSELLNMGYVSYFPLIALVSFFYFFCRYESFDRATFVIMASFFLFYVVFIFLPVAGPQYYYAAVGLEQIAAGVFPDVGHYFENQQTVLATPGWSDGFFYQMVVDAHEAGERPTAAFPSSHVGMTVVLLWLAWPASRRLFWIIMPFAVLMFFATFYIQAHYVIDAIAGVVAGTVLFFVCQGLFSLFPAKK
jgi:membrane-associated phospholipid phosphatase